MQSLCTLRNHCRQWSRNTRYQADATPYLDRTCTGRIAPACLAHSLDHLVGAHEQGRSDGEPKGFGSCKVENEFDLGRELYRQIGRLLALQNSVHVVGGSAIVLTQIDAIADQAAVLDVFAKVEDSGQARHQ